MLVYAVVIFPSLGFAWGLNVVCRALLTSFFSVDLLPTYLLANFRLGLVPSGEALMKVSFKFLGFWVPSLILVKGPKARQRCILVLVADEFLPQLTGNTTSPISFSL